MEVRDRKRLREGRLLQDAPVPQGAGAEVGEGLAVQTGHFVRSRATDAEVFEFVEGAGIGHRYIYHNGAVRRQVKNIRISDKEMLPYKIGTGMKRQRFRFMDAAKELS